MNKKLFCVLITLLVVAVLLNACNQRIIGAKKDIMLEDKKDTYKLPNGMRCLDHEECRSGYCGVTHYGDGVCMDDPGKSKR